MRLRYLILYGFPNGGMLRFQHSLVFLYMVFCVWSGTFEKLFSSLHYEATEEPRTKYYPFVCESLSTAATVFNRYHLHYIKLLFGAKTIYYR